tara:strand:+ start:2378 stop:3676 length:1299 start_codon:yes stop_codon:yes gene_type:complete
MALTQVTAGDTAQASDINQFKNALEGASGATVSYSLLVASGQNFLMTLPDNAAARKLSIRDSDLSEIFNVDSNGNMKAYGTATVVGTATVGALTTAGAVAGATVTASGAVQGATVVSVGALTAASADIAGTLQLGSSNITTCTAAGLLKHEAGGLEFDASAITTGGIVKGASSGVMAILARGSANQHLTVNAGGTDIAWATVAGASLVGVLEDFDESRALLMWSDFAGDVANAAWADRTSFDIGCTKWVDGGGTFNQETANSGGLIYLNTSADTSTSSAAIMHYEGGPADFNKDPRIKFKCNFEAATSALQVQAGGFNSARAPTDWDATSNDCAMFRSVTTGNLFAVTGSGSAETTTDLGSVYTLGNNAVFEIVSSGNGTSWAFKIDGTTRATHTSNLPDAKMQCMIGIANNTTTALRIDNLDYIWATQDRD